MKNYIEDRKVTVRRMASEEADYDVCRHYIYSFDKIARERERERERER